jgi:ascorbate PTS system EIIC component
MLDLTLSLIQTPAIVLGFVALIGLIIQGKNAGQVFSGTVKTAIGMLLVSAGAGLLVTNILPFVNLFATVFHLSGFATSSEAVVAAMTTTIPIVATTSSLIMAIGFLVNILFARFSPLKYVFLTGHMMWILSITLAFVLYNAGLGETMIIVTGSILQGAIMVILPALTQPLVRSTIGSNDFGIAHLTTLGTVPAGYIGGLLGNKAHNAEDIKLPEALEFFKDTANSITIVMGIFYMIVILVAGPAVVAANGGGTTNYIVFGLLQTLGFVAGILVLLQGVRMFLGELVPAFKGISDKLVPGAIPALDVPALFSFSPNSLMIGFVTSVVGMLIAMVVSSLVFGTVPLVSIIGAFFTGGVAGIFGNAKGGTRGAVIAGFIYGFMLIFGTAALSQLYNFATFGATGIGHDCLDAMGIMAGFKSIYLGLGIVAVSFILLCMQELKYKKNKAK